MTCIYCGEEMIDMTSPGSFAGLVCLVCHARYGADFINHETFMSWKPGKIPGKRCKLALDRGRRRRQYFRA